jgi:hypothetical protein
MLTAMALRGHPLLSCVVGRDERRDERRRTVASEEKTGARADELPGAARRNPKTGKRP